MIFRQEQPSRSALITRSTNTAVTQTALDDSEALLTVRGPGELMGDEGALTGEPRSATVKAVSDVVGLDIAAEDVVAFVDRHHPWPQMHRSAVRRRQESDNERATLSHLDVTRRVALTLLDLDRLRALVNDQD